MNIKVPGLEKLLDYASSGIGSVAGPLLAPWKAKREAKAIAIKAKANADSLTTIAEAQSNARQLLLDSHKIRGGVLKIGPETIRQRLDFQNAKREANIASVLGGAAEELGETRVPDIEPDHDWIARFFDHVQDVSSEDMQTIWSKILAREIEDPGKISLRTLSMLKDMSRSDAEMFSGIAPFHIDGMIHSHSYFSAINDDGEAGSRLILLKDLGLFFGNDTGYQLELNEDGKKVMECCNRGVIVSGSPGQKILIKEAVILNKSGREMMGLFDLDINLRYLRWFAFHMALDKCEVYYSSNIQKLPKGRIGIRQDDLILIEGIG